MGEFNNQKMDQLLESVPGGFVKLALDDQLTILYTTDTIYSLIKNIADKLAGKSPLALMRIVYSADVITLTQQVEAQKNRKDNLFSIRFRVLQQDGSFQWVMITGHKTNETYTAGSKNVPVYSCIAIDITDLMRDYKKLEQYVEYHNKIAELSKDLYFEYEIANDTLTFNEVFREIFGKDNVIQGFHSRLENTCTIHPDERPAINTIYNSMMRGRKQARFELRLIPKGGQPCGYICYASIIYDENKNPSKVVGKLSTVNQLAPVPEKKAYKPQLDSVTKVYTKEAAENMISVESKKQEEDELSALYLVNISNAHNIKKIKKAFYGDNILVRITEILRSNFRTLDIIGSLGQNEFIIYMRSIPSDDMVCETASNLCREIEAIHSYAYSGNTIRVSIGIAIHRGSQEYRMLLADAHSALAVAKKVSGSSFEIFCGVSN